MALKSIKSVTVSTATTTDYSEYETALKEVLDASLTSALNVFYVAELDTPEEATHFMHAAKTFATDNDVVYTQKRKTADNVKMFRFNTPKTEA